MGNQLLQGQRTLQDISFAQQTTEQKPIHDPVVWLHEKAAQLDHAFLLAHALDGVIWGRVHNGQLVTGHDVVPDEVPALRTETLQQARLFHENAEWYLWHDGAAWHLRETRDSANGSASNGAFDEMQILWGDYAEERYEGFTLLSEGMQGLRHLVPVAVTDDFPVTRNAETVSPRRVVLHMRHYLASIQGVQTIVRSRLVNIEEVTYE